MMKGIKTEVKAAFVLAILAIGYVVLALQSFLFSAGIGAAALCAGVAHGLLAGAAVAVNRRRSPSKTLRAGVLAASCVVTSCAVGYTGMYSHAGPAPENIVLLLAAASGIAVLWSVAVVVVIGYTIIEKSSIVAGGAAVATEVAEMSEVIVDDAYANPWRRPAATGHYASDNLL